MFKKLLTKNWLIKKTANMKEEREHEKSRTF